MAGKYNHVAVLMGGWSSEREVSLKSGMACAAALKQAGYKVTSVDVDRNLAKILENVNPDVCFNALHGKWGEDGCVQGLLEVMNLPYTHSGVLASSLAMDKKRAKTALQSAGVPVTEDRVVTRQEAASGHVLERPYVVKPVSDGSSVGIFIVMEDDDIPPGLAIAGKPDDLLMVEKFIAGREFTCAVMDGKALEVTEIRPGEGYEFYDFESKYSDGGSVHILPCELLRDVKDNVRDYSVKAHQALGCRGISRADFRFDDRPTGTGELICLEVNTQPGMTDKSLAPEQAAHTGLSFVELVRWIVEDASCNR